MYTADSFKMIKYLIIFLIVAIFISLFRGAFFLIKDGGSSKRTVHSLGVRVSIAIVLFITLVYGFVTGQIGPGV